MIKRRIQGLYQALTRMTNIEKAIEAIKNDELIIVTDDECRENEGDFICAGEI